MIDPGEPRPSRGPSPPASGPVAGAPVELLARRVGSRHGLVVVGTGTTASDGTVAITATPLRSQFYRLRVLRTEGVPGAVSERVRVDVRAATSLSIRGRTLTGAFVVSGVLRGAGGTLAHREVTLLAQAPGTTEWVPVAPADRSARQGPVRPAAGSRDGVPAVVRGRAAAGAVGQRRRDAVSRGKARLRSTS